jgi:hypothetical protein
MFAPSPRSPDVEYRIAYGLALFDCTALHASLSPANCADNFINRRCFACVGCRVGAEHAGKAPQSTPEPAHRSGECIRCGRKDTRRQIGAALCMSCYNREREVLRGTNRKGQWPRVSATRLHACTATIAGDGLMDKFRLEGHQHSPPEFPRLAQIETGLYLLDAIVTGSEELCRLVNRRLPGAVIITSTIGPSFSDAVQS